MKQWQLRAGTGFERLQQGGVAAPEPGDGEVLVRMRAASLNYRDLLNAKNPQQQSIVPLSDGAGEVVQVGANVREWKVGDRVAGCFFRDWQSGRFQMRYHEAALGGSVDGVLREYAVFPAHGIVRLPEHFSFEEGATLPCAGLTAWYALTTRGGLQASDSVLLQGTGGVSIWGLQIAVASGARVIITSSSDEKLKRARELGAHETINYMTSPDWDERVWELTEKRGVDHVLEVGGPETLGKSLGSVAPGGHVALIGVLTGFGAPQTSLFPLVSKNANLSGVYVGDRKSFESFVDFLNAIKIQPVIDRVFSWDEAPEAYAYMESGSHFGKVVVSI